MISYVKGTLEYMGDGMVIVEAGGIGYSISVSAVTASQLGQLHSQVKVFTYMSVKEDGVSLFGFRNMEELNLFNKLLSVSGIGPKGALTIVGSMSASQIIMAIVTEDLATLGKISGIGKKTAQRLVIELKDKFKNEEVIESINNDFSAADIGNSNEKSETIEALLALGYNRSEAVKAVAAVYQEGMNTQAILKLALKKMI